MRLISKEKPIIIMRELNFGIKYYPMRKTIIKEDASSKPFSWPENERQEGYLCAHCKTTIIKNCPACGAPNCCPRCCQEARMERLTELFKEEKET
jgi:hypothetical protein